MGNCNCKKGDNLNVNVINNNTQKIDESISKKIVKYSIKFIGFFLMVAMLPIINIVIIWFIFKTLVLNKDVDLKPLLLSIAEKIKSTDEEDDDDDEEDDDEEDDDEMQNMDDYVLLNVEDISNRN